jgi:hypothetical protein
MNVTDLLIKDYGIMDTWSSGKNKPNSNPIQSQFKPNNTQNKPNQTQNKPNSNPNKPNLMLPKIALSLSRFLRYNEWVMKNILLRYQKHGNAQ